MFLLLKRGKPLFFVNYYRNDIDEIKNLYYNEIRIGVNQMKKNGFTLTELLGVIIILGLIALIIFPNVNKSIKNSKKKLYDRQVGLIEENARKWGIDHASMLPESGAYYLELSELVKGGYITGKEIKDPRDESTMNGCVVIGYNDVYSQYDYKYTEASCQETKPPENSDKSGAEIPSLANGLIPIKWNGATWIRADKNNETGENQWYDYNSQMWANAASVTPDYRNVSVGTPIPEEKINAYFVWIPRYEYDYVNIQNYAGGTAELPGEIKVNFIKKDKTSPSSNYKIHPAFTFGSTQLAGIWVGKFETTGSASTPTIKPNLSSLRNQNVSTQFLAAQRFSASGNSYGISTSADAHMMKNSEWGAVAYLSQSKYGKYGNSSYSGVNKEVYPNKSDSYITGCSSGAPGASGSYGCAYTYEKSTGGTGASTTGTIYGVYDMSGGAWEYVMGVYSNTIGSSGFSSIPASKYYDNYTSSSTTYYGHALSETSGWYSDYAYFVDSSYPWFIRGGSCNSTTYAGVFYFDRGSGRAYNGGSFRVVVLG